MERCPNCRARLSDEATCRRCGMDLSRLSEIEAAAEHLLIYGCGNLLADRPTAARQLFQQARALHETNLTQALLGFLAQRT